MGKTLPAYAFSSSLLSLPSSRAGWSNVQVNVTVLRVLADSSFIELFDFAGKQEYVVRGFVLYIDVGGESVKVLRILDSSYFPVVREASEAAENVNRLVIE